MNGPYYAFQLLGESLGWGKVLMYIFAVVQALFMMAQLAVYLMHQVVSLPVTLPTNSCQNG